LAVVFLDFTFLVFVLGLVAMELLG